MAQPRRDRDRRDFGRNENMARHHSCRNETERRPDFPRDSIEIRDAYLSPRIEYCNRRFTQFLLFPRNEFLGLKINKIFATISWRIFGFVIGSCMYITGSINRFCFLHVNYFAELCTSIQGRLCPQDHWLNFPFNFDPLGLPSPLKWVSGCITAGTFLKTQIQFCAFWCVFGPIYWLHSWVLLQFFNSLYSLKAKSWLLSLNCPCHDGLY